jgi:hypothetical protein
MLMSPAFWKRFLTILTSIGIVITPWLLRNVQTKVGVVGYSSEINSMSLVIQNLPMVIASLLAQSAYLVFSTFAVFPVACALLLTDRQAPKPTRFFVGYICLSTLIIMAIIALARVGGELSGSMPLPHDIPLGRYLHLGNTLILLVGAYGVFHYAINPFNRTKALGFGICSLALITAFLPSKYVMPYSFISCSDLAWLNEAFWQGVFSWNAQTGDLKAVNLSVATFFSILFAILFIKDQRAKSVILLFIAVFSAWNGWTSAKYYQTIMSTHNQYNLLYKSLIRRNIAPENWVYDQSLSKDGSLPFEMEFWAGLEKASFQSRKAFKENNFHSRGSVFISKDKQANPPLFQAGEFFVYDNI